jgi:hypothetical protein
MDFNAQDQEEFLFFEMLNAGGTPPPATGFVLTESGFFVLTESGGNVDVE